MRRSRSPGIPPRAAFSGLPEARARPATSTSQEAIRVRGWILLAPIEGGLCDRCQHAKRVVSPRGSVFRLCLLHDTDPRFAKYPRLPVLRCDGYLELPPDPA
jgi:hypothetical protein